ncbi:hypothetical protein [Herbaspirillum seropedicae]|uniref:hypothetical protein n=1 Tax=Herbaspirillum seropedicae TaxID=964 RepID=UPI0028578625|nr:hypothetical protein [Herbaspirillum seropedicae]MDR6398340.1 hypothetical protein [Herbaspirillum seropedicae]
MRISTLLPLSAAAIAQKSRSTETKEKISDIDVCKALTGACALRPIRKEEGSLQDEAKSWFNLIGPEESKSLLGMS